MKTSTVRLSGAALLLALFAAGAAGQGRRDKWRIDPYTKNDPKKMAKAGYLNYGPFRFGNLAADPVQSTDIANTLSYLQILWVETEHFRIGQQLPQWQVPTDMATRRKIRAELTELKKKIPSINPKTRRLDPWLRLHLTAHRLEKLYQETLDLFGVKQNDFPTDASQVIVDPKATYMGYGPYMGMKDKFLVFVVEKEGPFRQYMKKYLGRDSKFPQRWHFTDSSSLIFTCSTESNDFPLKHDTALHCALYFNVSQNLLDGFRYYSYDLPVWIKEGFGHWNARRIDGKWSNFDQNEGSIADMKQLSKWKPYARGMIANTNKYAPFPTVASWRDFGAISFNDHVMIFSRMDFLLSQGSAKWKKFLFGVKGRVDENWMPDQKNLVGATRRALKDAYGLTFLNFDDRWKAWVKKTYPSK
ncbi:MAG TPA: hypothetical protein ENI87_02320 [bacterium]|nr:hypothetical protein [bacterium]